jgi:hypothetical protein
LDLIDVLNRYKDYGWSKEAICKKWGMNLKRFYIHPKTPCGLSGPKWNQLASITFSEQLIVRKYALEHRAKAS